MAKQKKYHVSGEISHTEIHKTKYKTRMCRLAP